MASKVGLCQACDCKEFLPNPWKEEKCMNCYHVHIGDTVRSPAMYSRSTTKFTSPAPYKKENTSTASSPQSLSNRTSMMTMREGPVMSLLDKNSSEDVLRKSAASLARMSSMNSFKNTYRDKIVKELAETEQTYVKNLNALVEHFVHPLRKDPKGGKNFNQLFGNIEEILGMNSVLLKSMLDRLESWDNDSTLIGDIFLDVGPYLKPYYTKYTENYSIAQNVLKECEKSSTFQAFLDEKMQSPELGGLSIRAYLIMPIQRIPRYNLLLADLLKHTEAKHPDYLNIKSSQEKMVAIADAINMAIKQGENRQKILKIQESFVNNGGNNFIEAHRVYIRDGPLMKVCRKSLKQRWFFLFNDLLVYASVFKEGGTLVSNNKYIFHGKFSLLGLRIEDLENDKSGKHAFMLVTPVKSFIVHAQSSEDKIEWMLDICNAVDDWKSRKATFGSDLNDQVFEAPVWVPDDEAKQCFVCSDSFGVIKRKHHCRACGACVCNNCSNHKVVLQNMGKKVRVCTNCFQELTKELNNIDKNNNRNTLVVTSNICHHCKKAVAATQPSVNVSGFVYHPDCVVCTSCKKKLTGGLHTEKNNLYCDNCYSNTIAPKCEYCKQPLLTGAYTTALGKSYHNEHFFCGKCKSVIKGPFGQKNGLVVCSNCN